MKPGTNGRRPRGRPNRKQHGGPARPNNFDSSSPEGRVRGNAHQVYERYLAMARDAVSAGDRVASETYYQHAEHYFRVLNSSTDPQQNGQARQDRRGGDGRRDDDRQDASQQDGGQQDGGQQDGGQQDASQQYDRQQDRQQDAGQQDASQRDRGQQGDRRDRAAAARAPQDAQGTNEASNGGQPAVPAANGQDTPPPGARHEPRGGRQPRRKAPAAPSAENTGANSAEPEPNSADAQPGARRDRDRKPASV